MAAAGLGPRPPARIGRGRGPGRVAMAAEGPFCGLVGLLESHRGRDRVVRTLSYACQLLGGALLARRPPDAPGPPLARRLLAFSAELSRCRTVLRLFDDLPMLACSLEYGLGAEEGDVVLRCLRLLSNVTDQLYYPCEHLAWAAEAGLLGGPPGPWGARCAALWVASLLLGLARSLRVLSQLRRRLPPHPSRAVLEDTRTRARSEALAILGHLADLANALWAGKSPPWLVGLMGTVSSLVGIYLAYSGAPVPPPGEV